jgi:hypothetical protein
MGADMYFSHQWLIAALSFSVAAFVHPGIHWGWAAGLFVGFAAVNIPVKMLLSAGFEFLRRRRDAA